MHNTKIAIRSSFYLIALLTCLTGRAAGQGSLPGYALNALARAEGTVGRVTKELDELRAKFDAEQKDPNRQSPGERYFRSYLQSLNRMETKLTGIGDDLQRSDCPPSHARTKAILSRAAALRERMQPWREGLAAKQKDLASAADPRNYPHLARDRDGLAEIARVCRGVRFDRPDDVRALRARLTDMVKSYNAFCVDYRALIAASGEKSEVARLCVAARSALVRADSGIAALRKNAPERARSALAGVKQLAETASARKDPDILDGQAMRGRLAAARAWLDLWGAVVKEGDPGLAAVLREFGEVSARNAATKAALIEKVTEENRAPEERYRGRDASDLRKRVAEAWKSRHRGDHVLEIRLHSPDWKRTKKLRRVGTGDTFEQVDKSVLVVTVIVKTDARVATTYPAYINRDNLDGSVVIGVDTKGTDYVHRRVLIANL